MPAVILLAFMLTSCSGDGELEAPGIGLQPQSLAVRADKLLRAPVCVCAPSGNELAT